MFEVQQFTVCDGWVNTWSIGDEPERFETRKDAKTELGIYLVDCLNAVLDGHLTDAPTLIEFRIVEVTE
jgi:hypothetical protein